MELFSGEKRKALTQIKAHLIAKYRERACARTIRLCLTVLEDMLEEVEILAHGKGTIPEGGEITNHQIPIHKEASMPNNQDALSIIGN